MTQFKRQVLAVLATGSMVLTSAGPAFAATSLEVTGNGSYSDNKVEIENNHSTSVVQSNTAVVTNNVTSNATTGGNKANDNTGGDVMVRTGDAATDTTVTNMLNKNMAHVDCCDKGDVDVLISGNGSHSDNDVDVKTGRHDSTEIFQDNVAEVTNSVSTDAKTGSNDAKRNTGGDVTVRTGDAMAKVDVSTTANANVATVGGNGNEAGALSARIVGNGSDSDNNIDLRVGHDTTIVQDNLAAVRNEIDANAKTGYNNTNDNTGGEVAILTGHALTDVAVDNLVNFNAADIDCGCLMDVDAKIGGNGYNSDSDIKAKFGGDQEVFQGGHEGNGNVAELWNSVGADAKTGTNDAKYNTGYDGADPYIWTGDAMSVNDVSNEGNVNVFGDGAHSGWPQVEWNFDFSHMWAF